MACLLLEGKMEASTKNIYFRICECWKLRMRSQQQHQQHRSQQNYRFNNRINILLQVSLDWDVGGHRGDVYCGRWRRGWRRVVLRLGWEVVWKHGRGVWHMTLLVLDMGPLGGSSEDLMRRTNNEAESISTFLHVPLIPVHLQFLPYKWDEEYDSLIGLSDDYDFFYNSSSSWAIVGTEKFSLVKKCGGWPWILKFTCIYPIKVELDNNDRIPPD